MILKFKSDPLYPGVLVDEVYKIIHDNILEDIKSIPSNILSDSMHELHLEGEFSCDILFKDTDIYKRESSSLPKILKFINKYYLINFKEYWCKKGKISHNKELNSIEYDLFLYPNQNKGE